MKYFLYIKMETITTELNRLEKTKYEDLIKFVYTKHTDDVPEKIVRNTFNYLKCMFLASYIKHFITGQGNEDYIKMICTGPKEAIIIFREDFDTSIGSPLEKSFSTEGVYIFYMEGVNEYHHACIVISNGEANVISVWGGTTTIYTITMSIERFWSNMYKLTTEPAINTTHVLKETFMEQSDDLFNPVIDYPDDPCFNRVRYEHIL